MAGMDCLSRSVFALMSTAVIKPRFTVHMIVEPYRSEDIGIWTDIFIKN